MHRWRIIDATTQTLSAHLFPSESLIEQQDGVGLYDGKYRDDSHGDGRLYLTTHRLVYLDAAEPHRRSLYLDLHLVRQTEHWIGFMKSSPKITLLIGDPPSKASASASASSDVGPSRPASSAAAAADGPREDWEPHPGERTWACHVCGFSNPPAARCQLCGVPRDRSATPPRPSSVAPPPAPPRPASAPPPPDVTALSLGEDQALSGATGAAAAAAAAAGQRKEIACPTCTFLNHPSMVRCEMCDSPLGTIRLPPPTSAPSLSSQAGPGSPSPTHSRSATPAPSSAFPAGAAYVRLSFRRGGDKPFYASLKATLRAKAWHAYRSPEAGASSLSLLGRDGSEGVGEVRGIGIDGIMRTLDWKEQAQEGEMQDALKDLEALMAKAKDMVQLAQSLSSKLSAASASEDPEGATLIRSSLLDLGLPAPAVTLDAVASEASYERELAKELGGLLVKPRERGHGSVRREPIMRDGPPLAAAQGDGGDAGRGLIGLDEVWCLWNRARGVSMVSPVELRSACVHLPAYTSPEIRLRRFSSGLLALHAPYFSAPAFAARLAGYLERAGFGGVSVLDVAKRERLGVALAQEMVEEAEAAGEVARDQGAGGGVRWWKNEIRGFIWVDPNAGREAPKESSLRLGVF